MEIAAPIAEQTISDATLQQGYDSLTGILWYGLWQDCSSTK